MYLLPLFLQQVLALPVALCGLVMFPGGIVNALVSAVSGRLYDRFGAQGLTRLGSRIAIIGALILLLTSFQKSLTLAIIGHIVLIVGTPLAMSPVQTYSLNSLSGPQSADGSAILNTLQQIVGALATAIITSLMASGSLQQLGQAGLQLGTQRGLIFVLILTLGAFLLSFKVQKAK
nr:MFS transporter [Bombilactobacillus apium]